MRRQERGLDERRVGGGYLGMRGYVETGVCSVDKEEDKRRREFTYGGENGI